MSTAPVAVITGANRGLGKATAMALAAHGATTILACRDTATARQVEHQIRSSTGNGAVHTVQLDLADLSSVSRCVGEIRRSAPTVDVLVNNAGGAWRTRAVSAQGVEATFAVNYLGHYALTRMLSGDLRKPGARVISVTSAGHRFARGITWDDVGLEHGWSSMRAYAQAKLAQILFTRELAKRADGIDAYAVHPGFVASDFYKGETTPQMAMERFVRLCLRIGVAKSPEQGAATAVQLATSAAAGTSSGTYWARSRARTPSRAARDDGDAERLWEFSESLVAGAGFPLPPC